MHYKKSPACGQITPPAEKRRPPHLRRATAAGYNWRGEEYTAHDHPARSPAHRPGGAAYRNQDRHLPARLPGRLRHDRHHCENGRVVKMGARADHPITRGFLCVKTQYYQERLYSPLRVLYPQRRVGPKGSGQFERISWDEAIATIAERFEADHRHRTAPRRSCLTATPGTMGALGYASMDRRFFHCLGASLLDRTICSTTGAEAYRLTMGSEPGHRPRRRSPKRG